MQCVHIYGVTVNKCEQETRKLLSNHVLDETCIHLNGGMQEKFLGTSSIYFHECLQTEYTGT